MNEKYKNLFKSIQMESEKLNKSMKILNMEKMIVYNENFYEKLLKKDIEFLKKNYTLEKLESILENTYRIKNIELFKNVLRYFRDLYINEKILKRIFFIISSNYYNFNENQLSVYVKEILFPVIINQARETRILYLTPLLSDELFSNYNFNFIKNECKEFIKNITSILPILNEFYSYQIVEVFNKLSDFIDSEIEIPEFIIAMINLSPNCKFKNDDRFKENKYIEYNYLLDNNRVQVIFAGLLFKETSTLTNDYLDFICTQFILCLYNEYGYPQKILYDGNTNKGSSNLFINNKNEIASKENLKLFVDRFIELISFTESQHIFLNVIKFLDYYQISSLININKVQSREFKIMLMERKLEK